MLMGTVPVVELPELNTPLVTSEVNWIYGLDTVSARSPPTFVLLLRFTNTHKAARFVASCAEEQLV